MKIDPGLAETLVTVVDEGTLDAAARRLHLTPSAVSQRLRTLEEQTGQRLLVRARPVRPTPVGEAVIRYGRQHTLLRAELDEQLGHDAHPRIPVAVNADSLATWFLPAVAAFSAQHPVEIDLHRLDQDRTVDLLEDGTAVAAVTSRAEAVPGCRATALGSMSFRAAAAPAWVDRWLPGGGTSPEFGRAPRIDYDAHDRLASSWLEHHGVGARHAPRHLVPSTHDIAAAVELGLGWAMVPTGQLAQLTAEGRLVDLGGPSVPTPLYWQAWKGPSAVLAALTEVVVASARSALDGLTPA